MRKWEREKEKVGNNKLLYSRGESQGSESNKEKGERGGGSGLERINRRVLLGWGSSSASKGGKVNNRIESPILEISGYSSSSAAWVPFPCLCSFSTPVRAAGSLIRAERDPKLGGERWGWKVEAGWKEGCDKSLETDMAQPQSPLWSGKISRQPYAYASDSPTHWPTFNSLLRTKSRRISPRIMMMGRGFGRFRIKNRNDWIGKSLIGTKGTKSEN